MIRGITAPSNGTEFTSMAILRWVQNTVSVRPDRSYYAVQGSSSLTRVIL